MAAQYFSPEYKNMWMAIGIAIVAMMIGFVLGRGSKR
jgi:hypothetical protein